MNEQLTRRSFVAIITGAGAGLVLGFRFGGAREHEHSLTEPGFAPNLWLRIRDDGSVTIQVAKAEMGQGVFTALPMLVAEELDADWDRVVIEQSPSRPPYNTETGGSDSTRSSFLPLRQAGAVARAMLIAAAAAEWNVPESECATEAGAVIHAASGRRRTYGALASRAATLPVPDAATVPLKSPERFRIIGRPLVRRDLDRKCDGSATFGIDVRVPNMLIASVTRCPVFDGGIARVDDRAALATPGVKKVLKLDAQRAYGLPARVAVVADNTWHAMKGRRALVVEWAGGTTSESSSRLFRAGRAATNEPGDQFINVGDVEAGKATASRIVEHTYEMPFLAHATMEPMNCTAHVTDSSAELWVPSQFPDAAQGYVARYLNLPLEAVTVHVPFLGGGFGRRYYRDFLIEAVEIAARVGQPVKVIWSREEDVQHDMYRPLSVQRLRAAIDAHGRPVTWEHRVAGPASAGYWGTNSQHPGAGDAPDAISYNIPNRLGDFVYVASTVPLGAWRAVRHSSNMFAIESFIDELAHESGTDPIAFRLGLLTDPRARRVLELVRDSSGWGTPLGRRHGRGVAFMNYAGTRVAHVAEVAVANDGAVSVSRLTCAFDCGQIVNPDTVRAQVEGAVAWGMSAALWGDVTIEGGRTKQSNFHDYRVVGMREMPRVSVHLVESHEAPSGVGEPAVPGVAPAITNAIFAATRERIRRLPLSSRSNTELQHER